MKFEVILLLVSMLFGLLSVWAFSISPNVCALMVTGCLVSLWGSMMSIEDDKHIN